MPSKLQTELQALREPGGRDILTGIRRGIEKESLRITPEGKLAQTPHPDALGSALTHDSITTDYSEALLEFITPVSDSIEDSLEKLRDIHRYVYRNIGDELLWAASMPCIVTGDDGIPVAQYGSSNVARMKTVYRYGLGHRYGRLMQAIAGIHYNFSMPGAYFEQAWRAAGSNGQLSDYMSERYLGLIRNFRRYSWLLIYLFGASPAVCASFLRGRTDHHLVPFDGDTRSMHLPHGTALRMGDLGYNSDAQKGLNVCYNSLDNYVQTLSSAIRLPHEPYRAYPSGENGDFQQLNDSLLQIENEFYSPIRPKRVAHSGESALGALVRGGIEYIEVRCVDLNPFTPVGLDAGQIRFLDTFLLHCLLSDSGECDDEEMAEQARNLEAVVNRGREPGLTLENSGEKITLAEWARQLLTEMSDVATAMDAAHDTSDYSASLEEQRAKVDDPELTPSARILREMRERDLPFMRLAMAYSEQWAQELRAEAMTSDVEQAFLDEATRSLAAQRDVEAGDSISFEQYLANFYTQYEAL